MPTKAYAWHASLTPPKHFERVQDAIHLLPGRALVHMVPKVHQTDGGILLMENQKRKWRPAMAHVLACGYIHTPLLAEKEVLTPGDLVLVNPSDGKCIENWSCKGFKATEEVRFLGIVCSAWGKPVAMPLTESIVAKYDPKTEQYTPLLSNLVLKLPPRCDKTEKGVALPDNLQIRGRGDVGTIIGKGNHVTDPELQIGKEVIFERRALIETKFDGKDDLALIGEDGVYCVCR